VAFAAIAILAAACTPLSAEPMGATSANQLSADSNSKKAFDFFIGKGLTAIQAAGIIGNLQQESGLDPAIEQLGGGPGRGIAQWSAGGRWDTGALNCTDFAAAQGKDVASLDVQLDFIWKELTDVTAFGLDDLKSATTLEDAVEIFQDKYEICGTCDAGNRVSFAQDALDSFGADVPPAPVDPTAPTTPTDTASTDHTDARDILQRRRGPQTPPE
jgi:hypothetical protein